MSAFDPVVLEILWSRMLSVCNEQQLTLMRTAFSTVVRESQDLACGVFDSRGYMIAQSQTGTPGHINAMATGVRHFLEAYPPEKLEPGDVLLTNDPWQTAGQINDMTVLTPVYLNGAIVAYFASTCHAPDVGGRMLSAEAREVFEEGIRIPITKLFTRGEPNAELVKLILANVRTPEETVGDLYAQTSSNAVGARSLLHLMSEFGLESIDPIADEIIGRSERALRDAIADLPNGRYENEIWSDGFESPICIRVAVTIADTDIHIDFAGSSPQSNRGINVVLNYTRAYASFAIKAAISPEVPHNDGAFRPVHVTAPEGSILNCREPAAVASRHLIGHFVPGAIFGALAQAMPAKLMAGGSEPVWISLWRGEWPDASRPPFLLSHFQLGGAGARASKDGLSTTGFPSGVGGVPVEIIESLTPLLQHRRELRTDSGGAGKFRGGLGQATEMRCLSGRPWEVSAMADRIQFPGPGIEGGAPGACGELLLNGNPALAKSLVQLDPDARVQLNLPGGGGYGDPTERSTQNVFMDVVNGYVSVEAAENLYGVRIRYVGPENRLVRLPEHYMIENATIGRRPRRMA
jgi:N-methylhydantoinase B